MKMPPNLVYESRETVQLLIVSFELDGLSWYKSCILRGFGHAWTIFEICSHFFLPCYSV